MDEEVFIDEKCKVCGEPTGSYSTWTKEEYGNFLDRTPEGKLRNTGLHPDCYLDPGPCENCGKETDIEVSARLLCEDCEQNKSIKDEEARIVQLSICYDPDTGERVRT